MPAVLKIDRQRRIVSSTFYGQVTGEDLLEHRDRIKADPEFNPGFADLTDFSGIKMIAVSESALARLAGTESLFHQDAPHIVVVPSDLPHSLATKYRDEVRQTRPNFHVVRSLAEAQQILAELGYQL